MEVLAWEFFTISVLSITEIFLALDRQDILIPRWFVA